MGATNLFERAEFEAFVLALPATSIVHQWGNASVAKVGDKIFATHNHWEDRENWQLSFKVSDLAFEMLPEVQGVTKAKYLARAKRVTARDDSDLTLEDIAAYIRESHRLIALKMSKPKKEKLGLTDPIYFTK